MGIPFWSIAAGSVALVWIYTHKSGIKTIVWTDTLQTFCLIAALICILVFVTAKLNLDFSGVKAIKRKCNIIIEGTMRNPDVPLKTAQKFKDAGFRVAMTTESLSLRNIGIKDRV